MPSGLVKKDWTVFDKNINVLTVHLFVVVYDEGQLQRIELQ